MKKGLLLLLASVMAFGVAVQSLASVRIDSMASNPRLIEDYDLIWLYANKVIDYKNTADFRQNGGLDIDSAFGGGDDEWGGLLIEEETLGGVLGIYVNRPNRKYTTAHSLVSTIGDPALYYWYFPGGSANSGGGGFIDGSVPWNILDLFYATELEGATLGFQLNYGDNGIAGIGGYENMAAGLSAALGFKDFGPFNEANIRAGYALHKYTHIGDDVDTDSDNGISTISVGGLFSADAGNDTTIRLSADVNINNADETDHDGESQSEITALLGLGCNHKVNGGKGLVSSGLLMSWVGGTYDDGVQDSFNSWTILWNGSVEASVTNWLTLRAGIQKALLARGYYDDDGTDRVYFDTVADEVIFTTGFGITWQNFTIDALIDIDSLQSLFAGPNAGAGIFYPGTNNQGIVEVAAVDLKYKF